MKIDLVLIIHKNTNIKINLYYKKIKIITANAKINLNLLKNKNKNFKIGLMNIRNN
jgi:hypothetical protein